MARNHIVKFPTEIDSNSFVTPKQVAELLKVSTKTVRRMTDNRGLRAYKIGRNTRYLVREVLDWIDIHARRRA